MTEELNPVDLELVAKLARDTRRTAAKLDRRSAGHLVGTYYRIQEHRIATGNQVNSLDKLGLASDVLKHFYDQLNQLEKQMVSVLGFWAKERVEGEWAQSILGIGPILSAALSAMIDIERAPTAGHIWSFAGLNPDMVWEKGQKRPYNADLKVVCWKIGDSFCKVSGRENSYYGKIYKERKVQEIERNERRLFADQAAKALETRNIKDAKLKECYLDGKLPPGRLELRARRVAVKLFLAHWHDVAFRSHFGTPPPAPYPIAILGHAHYRDPAEAS